MYFLMQNIFVCFPACLMFKYSTTVENVILRFATEVAVIWGESIPTDTIWGQPHINAIKESLKLERFSSLSTQARQGHL